MPILNTYPVITTLVGDEKLLCSSIHTSDDANNTTPFDIANYLLSIGGFILGASNVGASGQGVFKQEASGDLQFHKIDAASNKVSVSLVGDLIEIDVNQSNLSLSAIGGAISLSAQTTGLLSLTSQVSGILPVGNGGTGSSTYNLSSIPGTISLTTQVSGILPNADGGTGQSTYTNGQLLIGNASSQLTKATLTAGYGIGITNGNGSITVGSLLPNYITGLPLSFGGVNTAVIGSGSCIDLTNTFEIVSASNITVDITTSGANGLDSGSRSANNFYAVYIIADSTGVNSPKGLFSLSATSPTLPSGYNKFRRVGWVRNNSSNTLMGFVQSGKMSTRKYFWDDSVANFQCLVNGNATTFSAVSLAQCMPSTSTHAKVILTFTVPNTGAATDRFYVRPTGSSVSIANNINRFGSPSQGANPSVTQFEVVTNSSQSIDYAVTSTNDSASLNMLSWDDNL